MNQSKQNQRIKFSFALFVFVLLSGFLFFGNTGNVKAAVLDACNCFNRDSFGKYTQTFNTTTPTEKECATICDNKGSYYKYALGNYFPTLHNSKPAIQTIVNATNQDIGNLIKGPFGDVIKALLLGVLNLVGMLLSMAATIFGWMINVDNFKKVADGPVIYEIWKQVRDIINITFILVLLYSAFCTILQIEKYSYKKLLLNLVIMALLVNFSFPITRFIIDASNVLMYTIINTLLGANAGNALGNITANSGIEAILAPDNATVTYLIAAIIFGFILAITLLAIGILLIVRMIALALLIIFSPLAFVATILPDAGGYSTKWWDNIFKYSFFGPLMVFVIYIAARILTQMGNTQTLFKQIALKESVDGNMIGSMAYFAIPIILLWLGMGVAQSMSIAGAGAVMGGAQKFIKGTGKKFSGYNTIKKQYDTFAGARKKREEAKAKNRFGGKVGDFANKAQDTFVAGIPGVGGAARKRLDEMERKKIQEIREEWKKMGGASDIQLNDHLNSHDSAKRKAAAMEMAEKNGFGDGTNPAADLARYKSAFAAVENDPIYKKLFDGKVKEKHVRLIIADEIPTKGLALAYDNNLKNMTADQLAKQTNLLDKDEFHDNFMQAKKKSDPNFIVEVAKKATGGIRTDWKRTAPNRNYTI